MYGRNEYTSLLLSNSQSILHPTPHTLPTPPPRKKGTAACNQVVLQGILHLFRVGPELWQLAAVLPFSPRIKAKVPAVALQGPPGSGVSFSDPNSTQPHSLCSSYTGFLLPSLPSTLLGQSPWQSASSSWKALALQYPRDSLPHVPEALLRYILKGPFPDQPSLNCGHSPPFPLAQEPPDTDVVPL